MAIVSSAEETYSAPLVDGPVPIVLQHIGVGKSLALEMILDTGAAKAAFLDDRYESIATGTLSSAMVNLGEAQGKVGTLAQLIVGAKVLLMPEVGFYDLDPLFSYINGKATGVVGAAAFDQLALEFAYGKGRMVVYEAPFPDWNGYNVVQLSMELSVPSFEAILDGVKVPVVIDTGYTGFLRVPQPIFDRWIESQFAVPIENGGGQVVGVGKGSSLKKARLKSGTLLGQDLAGVEINAFSGHIPALLAGTSFLRRFDSILDFANAKLYYRARKRQTEPVFLEELTGVRMSYVGGVCAAAAVKPGGGAFEKAGGLVGDIIVKFGRIEEESLSLGSIYSECLLRRHQTVEVQIERRGDKRNIDLNLP